MTEIKKEIKYLPVFLMLTCVYFYDVFTTGAVLAIGDGFNYSFPLMTVMSKQYQDFIFPFWNPYMYSGFPLLASWEPGVLYPLNVVLFLLFKPVLAFNLNVMIHYSLAGFFTFLYAKQIGLSSIPSIIAGTIFSLLGYLPAHLQHPMLVTSGAWFPFIIYFFERLRQSLQLKDALYAALAIAVQAISGSHPQICFYTYIILLLFFIFHLFYFERSKRLRFALLGILSLALGLMIALPQIASTYELANMSYRAKLTYEQFSSYAFPVHMLPTFLFPFFYYFGGSYGGEFWGTVPDLGMEAFVGTLPFLLSILVLTRWKKAPHILFWGFIAMIALVMALSDAIPLLNRLLFHLPGYNSFRAPSKHILEMSFALSILTGFGISFLHDREKDRSFHRDLILLLSAVIFVSLISFTFFDATIRDFFKAGFSQMQHFQLRWASGNIPEKALSMADPSIYVPVVTMSIYLACLIALLKTTKKYLRETILAVIFIIIIGEGLSYKIVPVPNSSMVENYNKDLFTTLASNTPGRTVFFTNKVSHLNAMPYEIRLSEGYDSLELEDYKKILPTMYTQTPEICRDVIENNSLLSMMNTRFLVVDNILDNALHNTLDVRWYINQDKDGRSSPVPPVAIKPPNAELEPIYRKVSSFPEFSLYENTIALPRAHAVERLKPAGSIDDLMQMLFSFQLDPWHESALSAKDIREIGSKRFSPGNVSIQEEKPDRITIKTSFRGTGFVVLADQYYPGWEAYIDGSRSKIYKANGVQRGVVVPEGEHVLVFKYVPRRIYAAMTFSGILLFASLFVLVRDVRLREKR